MKKYQELLNKETKLAVIGLGYVGLPIALEFAKHIQVIGFDINESRIQLMQNQIDPSNELESKDFENTSIQFTSNINDLKEATFYIVTVPTPIDNYNKPDLAPLLSATEAIAKVLKKGDYVVYESTVYPGCTEEDCVPVLEAISGLIFKKDFKVGYSPERINPGDKEHTLTRITKVVSGCDEESLENISKTYEIVVKAGVYKASSIKVAEAAKIIENTQRDINIALMNELSLIFDKMKINTFEVLEAAGTKWNFLKFFPGLVGGHCIGVDPYYLSYQAEKMDVHARLITSGRAINDGMANFIAQKLVKKLLSLELTLKQTHILIKGITFKEDVTDIRNSKVADVVKELKEFGINVDVEDPLASAEEVEHEYGFSLIHQIDKKYDAVIIASPHKEYKQLSESDFVQLLTKDGIIYDLKGIYRNNINSLHYWTL